MRRTPMLMLLGAILSAGLAGAQPPSQDSIAARTERMAGRWEPLYGRYIDALTSGKPEPEAEIRRYESDLVALLREAPYDPAVRAPIEAQVRKLYTYMVSQPSPEMLDLVRRSPDPLALARSLALDGTEPPSQGRAVILLSVLGTRPGLPGLWLWSAEATRSGWSAALFEEAGRRLPDPGSDLAVPIAVRRLERLLESGLVSQAVDAYRTLPPAIRAQVDGGLTGSVSAVLDGYRFQAELTDLRPDLVAALLLAGDERGAAALEAKLPPLPLLPTPDAAQAYDSVRGMARVRLVRELSARWLHPSPDDPYPLFVRAAGNCELGGVPDLAPLLARVAEKEGYPAVASFASGAGARYLRGRSFAAPAGLPARVASVGRSLEAGLTALKDRLAADAAKVDPVSPLVPPDARQAAFDLIAPVRPGESPVLGDLRMGLFFTDREGRRAFAIYAFRPPRGPAGGTVELTQEGGAWRGEVTHSWIA